MAHSLTPVLDWRLQTRIVAVVRLEAYDQVLAVAAALLERGVRMPLTGAGRSPPVLRRACARRQRVERHRACAPGGCGRHRGWCAGCPPAVRPSLPPAGHTRARFSQARTPGKRGTVHAAGIPPGAPGPGVTSCSGSPGG